VLPQGHAPLQADSRTVAGVVNLVELAAAERSTGTQGVEGAGLVGTGAPSYRGFRYPAEIINHVPTRLESADDHGQVCIGAVCGPSPAGETTLNNAGKMRR
jgi:hypothetical protein